MPRHTRAVSRPLSMQSVRATLDAIRTCSGVSCAPTASWPGGLQGAVPCPRRQRTRRARSPRELRSDLRRWRSVTETLRALISDQDDALQHTQSRFFRGKVYISTSEAQVDFAFTFAHFSCRRLLGCLRPQMLPRQSSRRPAAAAMSLGSRRPCERSVSRCSTGHHASC